MLLLTQT